MKEFILEHYFIMIVFSIASILIWWLFNRCQNQSIVKKAKWFLQHVDGIWSLPVAFFIFWFVGSGLLSVFGYGTGTYDPGLLQAFFLAAFIVIGATNVAVWGLYFTFRGLYRYVYGQKDQEGKITNYSKIDWKKLSPWQRYIVAFVSFFSFVCLTILVFLSLV